MTPDDVAAAMHRKRAEHRQEFIRTGSLGLDLALGGGWPAGRVSELAGPPDSGKSTLAYYAAANVQAGGPDRLVGFVDKHGTFNPDFARAVGVDLNRLIVIRTLVFLPLLVTICSLIIVDPLLEYPHVSSFAQTVLYTTELRKNLSRHRTGGVISTGGDLESSARVSLRAILRESVQTTSYSVEEASFAAPTGYRTGQFDILGHGINHALEVLDIAVMEGLIEKRGNWYRFLGWITPQIQGRDAAATWLAEHPKVLAAMETQVRTESST